jgi:ribonuclease BN (tRNA processing enzyme)
MFFWRTRMKKRTVLIFLLLVTTVFSYMSCMEKTGKAELTTLRETKKLKTQVVLLGTGTPNAEPDRSGTSVAIVVNDTPYLVDFGPGVVRRANAAFKKGVKGLELSNLKTAFLTHLHSDHTTGYPDLIFTPWVLERKTPLEVYGPPGLNSMTEHILKAYEEDIDNRINGLEQANTEGCKVNVHEIEPGVIYEDENVKVRAFPVKHGAWAHAYGFRFETPDRVVVISGDCTPDRSLIENSKGCDALVHEVYSASGFLRRSEKWKKYHAASHTSTRELGKIAAEVKPGLLILYHQLAWGASPEDMLSEIREFYDGKVIYGNDLDVY